MTLRPGTGTAGGPDRVSRLDVALGAAAVVVGELEVWVPALSSGRQAMEHRPALTLAALVAGAALVFRRVRPLLSLPLVLAAVQAQMWLAGTESVTGLAAVLVALFAVGTTAARHPALLGLGVAVWWVLLQGEDLADQAFGLLLVTGPWAAGRLVRGRQLLLDELGVRNRQLEAEQRKTAVLAAAEERARIARDMHDVVAHSLTVMIVQAQAAEAHLTSARGDPDRAAEALSAVQHVGRDALLQTRRLVGALADDGDAARSPSPGLAGVDALLDTVRGVGLPVTLATSGPPRALPPGVDGTAYRLVQEALTNVVKHAGPAAAVVRIAYRPGGLDVEVSDDGAGPGAAAIAGEAGGRGLQGMRYRVEACGGRLTVEAPEGGGFVVAARFPAPVQETAGAPDRILT